MNFLDKNKVLPKLHQRVEFLIDYLPKLEETINMIQTEMADRGVKYSSIPELAKMYTEMFRFYNKSLETIRLILIYFPMNMSEETQSLMMAYSVLKDVDKREITDYINKIIKSYGPIEASNDE
jgi:hypothetical protein